MKKAILVALPLAACPAQVLAEHCQLAPILELPVSLMDSRPVMTAKVNGADALFMVDSGAFYSLMSRASAAQFQLPTEMAPIGFFVEGVGGNTRPLIATVKDFGLGGQTAHDIEFLVGGSDVGGNLAGTIGQNVLSIADVDYDLAKGLIRLFHPLDCNNADLAYWAGSTPHWAIAIDSTSPTHPQTWGQAFLNGKAIRVMFDTGSTASTLSRQAAARVGVTPDSPGVIEAGYVTGVGQRRVRTWIATFPSFRIGNEEVRNARLRFADSELPDSDMLLGADFFLSHHVYVSRSQRKLYFTYNGGPVFNLIVPAPAAPAMASPATDASAAESVPASAQNTPLAAGNAGTQAAAGEPPDADGYARRGAASSARRDYVPALADLSRACELAPNEPTYRYERAELHLRLQEPVPARADVDRALEIRPDYLEALLLRSELRFKADDKSGAATDIDAAEHVAPRESDARMQIARMYENLERMQDALAQWDLWVANHGEDAKLPVALVSRCGIKALIRQDLDHALTDCNRAVRLRPDAAYYLETRAFAKFRRGEFKDSLADYDAARKLIPKPEQNSGWALYVRGLDLLKLGRTAEGHSEMEAATQLKPKVAEELSKYGIAP